jgi:hypothetical protein
MGEGYAAMGDGSSVASELRAVPGSAVDAAQVDEEMMEVLMVWRP